LTRTSPCIILCSNLLKREKKSLKCGDRKHEEAKTKGTKTGDRRPKGVVIKIAIAKADWELMKQVADYFESTGKKRCE